MAANWYDNTNRRQLAKDQAVEGEVEARDLGAGGSLTNQRILAPPGDTKGIEHDPETSERLPRHPSSPNEVGEQRNRERPIAQTDPGNSRPLNQRDPRANDGNEDRQTHVKPDENRKDGEDDVSDKTQGVGELSDQYVPKRNASWYPGATPYRGMGNRTRNGPLGPRVMVGQDRRRGA